MKTQVVIVGAGPSGLLLSLLLNRAGIESVILERATREHVLGRIRAGVLESGTVQTLREACVHERMDREGMLHNGCYLTDDNLMVHIDFHELTGKQLMVYGQTEVTADLYAAHDAIGATIVHSVEDVQIHAPDQSRSFVEYTVNSKRERIDCLYIAGCDGFHGVCRKTIPQQHRTEYERVYPFGWLGVLSRTPPASRELIYANSKHGFCLLYTSDAADE